MLGNIDMPAVATICKIPPNRASAPHTIPAIANAFAVPDFFFLTRQQMPVVSAAMESTY